MTERLYPLGRVQIGQPLQTAVTAERLNRVAKNFESLNRVLLTVPDGYVQDIGDPDDGPTGVTTLPTSATVTEVSRQVSAVLVTDSNGDTHTINVTTQIVADGTWNNGAPFSLTINFDPP